MGLFPYKLYILSCIISLVFKINKYLMCLILVNYKKCYDKKLYRLLEQIWVLWVGASLVFAAWYRNIFVCICMPNTYSFIFMYNSYIIHRDKIYETKIQTKWKNKNGQTDVPLHFEKKKIAKNIQKYCAVVKIAKNLLFTPENQPTTRRQTAKSPPEQTEFTFSVSSEG